MSSKNGMLTWVWGPVMWYVLHYLSFRYPKNPSHKEKILYRTFIEYLEFVLPCGACRTNFHSNIHENPLKDADLEDRCGFAAWVYNFHNCVNKMTKNSLYVAPSFDEVVQTYTDPLFFDACVSIHIIPKTKSDQHNIITKCGNLELVNYSKTDTIGLPFWFVLLCIGFNYPFEPTIEQQSAYEIFFDTSFRIFEMLTKVHIQDIKTNRSCFNSRLSFSTHIVNLLCSYSNETYDYQMIRKFIEKFRAKCDNKNKASSVESGCVNILSGKKCQATILIQPRHGSCMDFLNSVRVSSECYK